MNYKTVLGKSFIDPGDLWRTRLDLATIDPQELLAIAEAITRSKDFTPSDGDVIAKVARVLHRVKIDLDVADLETIRKEAHNEKD